MKVIDLIKILEKYNPELQVGCWNCENEFDELAIHEYETDLKGSLIDEDRKTALCCERHNNLNKDCPKDKTGKCNITFNPTHLIIEMEI